jgi:hypothetical protein
MGDFHVHIDAETLSAGLTDYLVGELGFWNSDFSGHPPGFEHFEPVHHLTQKAVTGRDLKSLFDKVVVRAADAGAMKGYIEAEFVASDETLAPRPFDESVFRPFRLRMTRLPEASFRESEIHVTLDRDRSHPQLQRDLLEMGLYGAYLPKSYGTAAIFTAQGARAKIAELLPVLTDYLERAGGAEEGSIKEERIVSWWLSEPRLSLPPVVDTIDVGGSALKLAGS